MASAKKYSLYHHASQSGESHVLRPLLTPTKMPEVDLISSCGRCIIMNSILISNDGILTRNKNMRQNYSSVVNECLFEISRLGHDSVMKIMWAVMKAWLWLPWTNWIFYCDPSRESEQRLQINCKMLWNYVESEIWVYGIRFTLHASWSYGLSRCWRSADVIHLTAGTQHSNSSPICLDKYNFRRTVSKRGQQTIRQRVH